MRHTLWLSGLVLAVLIGRADAQAPGAQTNATAFGYAGGPVITFAANPTDWVVLTGSSGQKSVAVTLISVCGGVSAGNPAATLNISIIRRSSVDSGGSGAAITPGNQTGNGVAATSAVTVYSANPTLGTTAAIIRSAVVNAGGPGSGGCTGLEFGTRTPSGPLILRGATQQVAINLQGVTMPSGVSLSWGIEVVEQ